MVCDGGGWSEAVPCRPVTKGEAAVGGGAERWRVRRPSEGRAVTNPSLAAHENGVLVCRSRSRGSGSDSTSAEVLGNGGRTASAVLHVDAVNDSLGSRRFGATRR